MCDIIGDHRCMSRYLPNTCTAYIYTWVGSNDGVYEGTCIRLADHHDPHFDGVSWWNDDREFVPEPDLTVYYF